MMRMSRTTVDVDERALALAQEVLGTTGLSATVNAALREVGRRQVLATFDVRSDVDGTPHEVRTNRQDRHPA